MVIIIAIAIIAGIIFLFYRSGKKAEKMAEAQNQFFEDTLRAHPELGNYKRFYGGQGILLVLSESGYVAYFQGADFTVKKIDEVKSIKFIAQPFDRKTKKIIDFAGTISYRLDLIDFNNPIIDLPFGAYKDNADKLAQTTAFAEVKSTFDYIKKNPTSSQTAR